MDIVVREKPQTLFVEAHIADIHFGVIDPATEFKILKEQFLDYIYQMQVLDIVSINGDIFHHKFIASSDAVMYAMYFMRTLLDICRAKGATVILISGTASHDSDQIKMFYPFTESYDLRIINYTQFIYVKGKRILCIPEEYNKGEEYYNRFLVYGGLYDSCYMHGTYKGSIYGKNLHDLNSNREPVFDIMDFSSCKGPVISGHVHIFNNYNDEFFYCGSPIRWCFGEERDKGFLILLHNIETRKYKVHLEKIHSFRYETIRLSDLIGQDPNTIIQYIHQVKSLGIDYLRIIFTINDSDKIAMLKSYYRNRPDIRIECDFERQQIENELNKMEEENRSKVAYLVDPNLSPEEKLVQYMNTNEGNSYWSVDLLQKFMEDIKRL